MAIFAWFYGLKVEALKLDFNLSLAVGGSGWAPADVLKFAKAIDSDAHAGPVSSIAPPPLYSEKMWRKVHFAHV